MTDSLEKKEKKTFIRGVEEKKPCLTFRMGLTSNSGVALLMALIITVIVFLMIVSTLYLVTQGTMISGSRRSYDTACKASDGAVELTKDAIERTFSNDTLPGPNLFSTAFTSCLGANVYINNTSCTEQNFTMPASMGGTYTATIAVTRIAARVMTGGSIEFPPKAFGKNIAIFFKITSMVTGANGLSCEDAVVYRHI